MKIEHSPESKKTVILDSCALCGKGFENTNAVDGNIRIHFIAHHPYLHGFVGRLPKEKYNE